MLGKIMLLVHLLTDLRLLAGPDAPVVDGVAVAGEEDQDGEGNDADHSPLQLCNNHKVSSQSHGFSPRHSVLTVVIKPVNDGLEAVVLDYHILDAVVSTHDVFPSVNIKIDFDYDTRY